MPKRTLIVLFGLLFVFSSYIVAVNKPRPKKIKFPSNFPDLTYNLQNNPITHEGFALGRALFYDNELSRDSSVSCASCHQQSSAFVQADHDLSHGVEDRLGRRNSLPIFNALYRRSFFWDGGVPSLDFVPVNPIENELEMDEKMDHVVWKLNQSKPYKLLFKNAFGVDSIATKDVLQAFSQFMNAIISANSKYDKYVRKEGVVYTIAEKKGLYLFEQKCSSCHAGALFTDDSFRNNGLQSSSFSDKGREDITLDITDRATFKVPSLRNVALTAPYMHDGRFNTLSEVLNHYSSGVKMSPTLDPLLKKSSRMGIPLSSQEKVYIITFLKTLTDYTLINNPEFSNPYR